MAKLNVSEELPVGAKTEDMLRALRGRMWGENRKESKMLFWDLEHGVADTKILDSNADYALVEVQNHREDHTIHWLMGRSSDREDAYFVHVVRAYKGEQTVEDILRAVDRRAEGFSRRIQGDVLMGLGSLKVTLWENIPHGGGLPSERGVPREWEISMGGQTERFSHGFRNESLDMNARDIVHPHGGYVEDHAVTCPEGVQSLPLNKFGPVLIAFGTFDIAHVQHDAKTVEVPKGFIAVLASQNRGPTSTYGTQPVSGAYD